MSKGYLRNVVNEAYVNEVQLSKDKKRFAVTSTVGRQMQTKILQSWDVVKKHAARVIANGEQVDSIYELGAKVEVPDVSKMISQIRQERTHSSRTINGPFS